MKLGKLSLNKTSIYEPCKYVNCTLNMDVFDKGLKSPFIKNRCKLFKINNNFLKLHNRSLFLELRVIYLVVIRNNRMYPTSRG